MVYGSRGIKSIMSGKAWYGNKNRKLTDQFTFSSTNRKQRGPAGSGMSL